MPIDRSALYITKKKGCEEDDLERTGYSPNEQMTEERVRIRRVKKRKSNRRKQKMNEIMTFVNEEFGSVRTISINGEPWLVAKDISEILGYAQTSNMIKRIDDEDFISSKLDGMNMKSLLINESGLYAAIIGSKLPNAKKFKRWVTSVVLPTIRKTGGYVNDADKFVNTYLPFADEPTKNLFRIQFEYINKLNDRIRRDKPKVKFADHVSDTVNLIDMNDMAKLCADHGIRIGRTRLFKWLRSNGILMEGNIPYQNFIERGYIKVKESVFDLYGEPKTYQQPMVTGRGQQYILARLMREYGTEVPNA